MGSSYRRIANSVAVALALTCTWLILTSVRHNSLEGWGMLLRALLGHALCIGAVECASHAKHGRGGTGVAAVVARRRSRR